MRLRARPVDDAASKTKRRGRQVRYGSIEPSGTARVKEPQVQVRFLCKNKKRKRLPKTSTFKKLVEVTGLEPAASASRTHLKASCLAIFGGL